MWAIFAFAVAMSGDAVWTCPEVGDVAAQTAVHRAAMFVCSQYREADVELRVSLMSRENVPGAAVETGFSAAERHGSRVWVEGTENGQRVRYGFRLHRHADAWTALHTLPAKAVIASTDVAWTKVELRENDVLRMASPVGLRTTQVIRKGRVLNAQLVERVPRVQRGETVQATVLVNGIQLNFVGVALQDGWPNGRVAVRTTFSEGALHGTVKESGLVEIDH